MSQVWPKLRSKNSGFTLLEASLVTVIIGIGVAAMLQLLAVGSISNSNGTAMTTGLNLAKGIREMSLGMAFCDPTSPTNFGAESGETLSSYDDIDDLHGKTFSPPIDARRQAISDYANWSQVVSVSSVDPDLVTLNVPNGTTPSLRVTVTILHHGKFVCSTNWLAFEAMP